MKLWVERWKWGDGFPEQRHSRKQGGKTVWSVQRAVSSQAPGMVAGDEAGGVSRELVIQGLDTRLRS